MSIFSFLCGIFGANDEGSAAGYGHAAGEQSYRAVLVDAVW